MFELDSEILDSFTEINKAIYRLIRKEADRFGITFVQLKAIYRISTHPEISLGELAEKLRLTNSTVSGVIDRLVHSGLVERVIPPENRRSVSINLTEKGENLLREIMESDTGAIAKIKRLNDLPDEETKNLLRLHKILLEKLSTEEETN